MGSGRRLCKMRLRAAGLRSVRAAACAELWAAGCRQRSVRYCGQRPARLCGAAQRVGQRGRWRQRRRCAAMRAAAGAETRAAGCCALGAALRCGWQPALCCRQRPPAKVSASILSSCGQRAVLTWRAARLHHAETVGILLLGLSFGAVCGSAPAAGCASTGRSRIQPIFVVDYRRIRCYKAGQLIASHKRKNCISFSRRSREFAPFRRSPH